MSSDSITHLNGKESSPFFSKLEATVAASQQGKSSAQQWAAMIRALTQKGVKEIEIAESTVLGMLASLKADEVLTKAALVNRINTMTFTIKEVGLGSPQYAVHRQPGGEYKEFLYIANSERDNVNEELETVEYEMEVLAFDIGADDLPEKLSALEIRRTALIDRQPLAIDFIAPHFSREIQGKHGRNLMAHCRVTIRDDIYFIEEIQSDWGQRGRRYGWLTEKDLAAAESIPKLWGGLSRTAFIDGVVQEVLTTMARPGANAAEALLLNEMAHLEGAARADAEAESFHDRASDNLSTTPRGPMVTNTEAWAGMVLRRHLQLAARDPKIKQVAWMTASMSNGAEQRPLHEEKQVEMAKKRRDLVAEKAAETISALTVKDMSQEQKVLLKRLAALKGGVAADAARLPAVHDGMNAFYMTTLPNLADKLLKGTGETVMIKTLDFKNNRQPVSVPTIEMTPAVRDKLMAAQPMYSRALLNPVPRAANEEGLAETLRRAGAMTGSAMRVHLVAAVYDLVTGKRVAGRYENSLTQLALDAKDIDEVADHETFHYAEDRMLSQREKQLMLDNFQSGGELHFQVQDTLIRRGDHALALQCQDPHEAAAQGFALWRKGLLDAAPVPVTGVFSDIVNAVRDVVSWLKREVLEHKLQTVEDIYSALNSGELAERSEDRRAKYERAGMTNSY